MSTATTTFAHIAGIHASKADDHTFPVEDADQIVEERIAEALESIAHSLVALNLLTLAAFDQYSHVREEFAIGWRNQA